MASLKKIRIGLEIFERHGGTDCDAQHDVFYAGQAPGEALTPEEIKTLTAASWRYSCGGCAEEGDAGAVQEPSTDDDPIWHSLACNEWEIFT